MICLVRFNKNKQRQLQPFFDYGIPVTQKNVHIQRNRFKNTFEVVLKSHTTIEETDTQLNVTDLKTAGSAIITLSQLPQLPEHYRVMVKVAVLKVNNAQKLQGGTKTVIIADATGRATITLWGKDINILKATKSSQFNRLEVHTNTTSV